MEKNEKIKLGFWKRFFMVMGVIFTALIIMTIGVIIYIFLPYSLFGNKDNKSSYDHPLLSEGQEATLESLGVDVSKIPTQFTTKDEQCAISALGQTRVNEIKAGATPSALDILKASSCLK